MILSFLELCKSTNFNLTINLLELMIMVSVLFLTTLVLICIKMIVQIIRKEKQINEHLRKTRYRISKVVKEMENRNDFRAYAEEIRIGLSVGKENRYSEVSEQSLIEDTEKSASQRMIENYESMIKHSRSVVNELEQAKVKTEEIPKVKKTRAMSMEERWADFERKRGMRNSA